MSKKKIVDKKNRKEDLDPTKDQFLTRTMSVMEWAYERRRPIGLAVGIALLAGIIVIAVGEIQDRLQISASTQLAESLGVALAPVVQSADEQQIEAQRGRVLFRTTSERSKEALKKFQTFTEDHAASDVGVVGEIGLAGAYYDSGKFNEAVTAYRKVIDSGGEALAWLRPAAEEGLGYALEASGKIDDAKTAFSTLAEKGQGVAAKTARYHLARIAQRKGNRDEAIRLFKEVIDAYVQKGDFDRFDFLFVQSRERLLALDPKADVPSLPGGGLGDLSDIDPAILEQMLRSRAGG